MSDLFISYASENRERVRTLVYALEQQGWSVWWDRKILVGKKYDEVILKALEEAKCVIVVWTKESISSNFVKDEAKRANEQGKLFPVCLEDVVPPLGFGVIQTENLADWDVKSAHQGFARLVVALRGQCLPAFYAEYSRERPSNLLNSIAWSLKVVGIQKVLPILLLLGVPFIIGILLWNIPLNTAEVKLQAAVSEFSIVSTIQQNLSDPIGLLGVNAAGVSRINIPSTSESLQESLTGKEGMYGRVLIAPRSNGRESGSITLDTITLPAEAFLGFIKNKEHPPTEYNLKFEQQPPRSIEVIVKGPTDINVPGIGVKSRLFSFPQTLHLQLEPIDPHLQLTVLETPTNLLSSPLSVTSLNFSKDNASRSEDHIPKPIVSAILNNEFLLNGEQQQLALGAYLRFEHSLGKLTMIRLNQHNLKIEFHGEVQGMKSCEAENECISLMPTYGEWLMENTFVVLIASALYLALIILGGILWRNSRSKVS